MTQAETSPAPPGSPSARIGILLSNLGTPDGTDYWSMRRYLKEFLSDRRVVDTNRLLWWPILNLVILTLRPRRKGRDYARIWNRERNESPLRTITRAQADRLAGHFAPEPRIVVDWGMRYGRPSIGEAIERLAAAGCDRLLLFPLYPQYSAATTATACDAAFARLAAMRRQPALRVVPPYHDDPTYIEAIAGSIEAGIGTLDFEPEVVIASFHGLPRRYAEAGDPYHLQCLETARLVRDRLGLPEARFRATFQSRFGREEWLRPYTDETIAALARAGTRRIAVVAPGFAADCLETLEELDVENRDIFRAHGGEAFAYIPCLNDSERGMAVITRLVERELSGWIAPEGAPERGQSG